jgi:hypothetical protein
MYGEMIIFALTWEKIPCPSRQQDNKTTVETRSLARPRFQSCQKFDLLVEEQQYSAEHDEQSIISSLTLTGDVYGMNPLNRNAE